MRKKKILFLSVAFVFMCVTFASAEEPIVVDTQNKDAVGQLYRIMTEMNRDTQKKPSVSPPPSYSQPQPYQQQTTTNKTITVSADKVTLPELLKLVELQSGNTVSFAYKQTGKKIGVYTKTPPGNYKKIVLGGKYSGTIDGVINEICSVSGIACSREGNLVKVSLSSQGKIGYGSYYPVGANRPQPPQQYQTYFPQTSQPQYQAYQPQSQPMQPPQQYSSAPVQQPSYSGPQYPVQQNQPPQNYRYVPSPSQYNPQQFIGGTSSGEDMVWVDNVVMRLFDTKQPIDWKRIVRETGYIKNITDHAFEVSSEVAKNFIESLLSISEIKKISKGERIVTRDEDTGFEINAGVYRKSNGEYVVQILQTLSRVSVSKQRLATIKIPPITNQMIIITNLIENQNKFLVIEPDKGGN